MYRSVSKSENRSKRQSFSYEDAEDFWEDDTTSYNY